LYQTDKLPGDVELDAAIAVAACWSDVVIYLENRAGICRKHFENTRCERKRGAAVRELVKSAGAAVVAQLKRIWTTSDSSQEGNE
jgi:hypothetical protein